MVLPASAANHFNKFLNDDEGCGVQGGIELNGK